MRPKTSAIWNYFVLIDMEKARCKLCDKVYSRKGRTTTALKSHLKAMHAEQFAEFEKLNEAANLSSEMKRETFHGEEDCHVQKVDDEDENVQPSPTASEASDGAVPTSIAYTPSYAHPPKKKTKILLNAVKDLKDLYEAINADEDNEDSFDAFGHSVAKQLRKLSEVRALLAQQAIQEILTNYGIEDIEGKKQSCSPSRISGDY